jgi:hypothetical protein
MLPLKVKRTILATCLALCVVGCANRQNRSASLPLRRPVRSHAIGRWDNPYRGDPKLAGVRVYQLGECPYEQWRYEGKHPAGIWFYFWDGRVRQIGYEPNGSVDNDFWWPTRLKPGDSYWLDVDFSHGSDPAFQHHADPRLKR